jgi:hypothetical protein
MTANIIDFPQRPEPSRDQQRKLEDMAFRLLDKPRNLPRRPSRYDDGPEAA